MYWALGNDLKSVFDNSTALGESSTLITSLAHSNYEAEQTFLGPFGSIDMIMSAFLLLYKKWRGDFSNLFSEFKRT
ncbi:hypothetical protein THRCLA_20253 [Thraustotheca clavata]|uniref:Uncharacterized protein n=1 Tax=Thraustotheca clavata TaxID=74557 RepID=A0A1W0A9H7_9STRA|nr:hypothetical protein THRCLA_20253 [Thraustotheca clavata]